MPKGDYRLGRSCQMKESLSSLIGVVIEQINLCRLDLDKVQRLYNLSPRERAVVVALAVGKTDKQIASIMDVSPETVRWYLKNIRTKMDVSTRTGIQHKMFFM
jgi:DNA-binding CsgD family transcriptional regulator